MAQDVAVRVEDLTKAFGRTVALKGVTFDIPAQTVFGLLGPNAAGKTTLFSIAAGFLKPTRGSVEVLGINVERISELRGRLSILPQDAMFQANVPILEQLVFFCQLSGYSRQAAREEALRSLQIVGLGEAARKNARVLSHGMSKRLGIAQAFLGHPEVILLDEPTSGLDPANAKSIRDLIQSLKTTATLVVSSHNLREIQEMCSHVAILDHGRLVECNEVAAITQADKQLRMSFARALTPAEGRLVMSVAGVTGLTMDREGEYTVHIDLAKAGRTQDELIAEVVQKLLPGGLVPRSISEGATLESRFLEVTGQGDAREALCPSCGAHLDPNRLPERCPECREPLNRSARDVPPGPPEERIRRGDPRPKEW
jgi:ABC-type multidrug transport system ATPase subunit